MSGKTLIKFIVSVIMAALLLPGCGVQKLRELKISSWSIESLSLRGLRSLDATMSLGIENPGTKVSLDDISGTIFYKGESLLHYTVEPLTLKSRCTAEYPCACSISIDPGKSIIDILGAIEGFDPNLVTTDIGAKVKVKGIFTRKVEFKNIPIQRLAGRFSKKDGNS